MNAAYRDEVAPLVRRREELQKEKTELQAKRDARLAAPAETRDMVVPFLVLACIILPFITAYAGCVNGESNPAGCVP